MSKITDLYIPENHELDDFVCDQTIIIRKKYLPYISRGTYKEEILPPQKPLDWYPSCNEYYPYLEDGDALNRSGLLEDLLSNISSTSILCGNTEFEDDAYGERDAHINYLNSSPASFIILGKPGLGEQELGKLLAEHWRCVYIDPETLIQEEISCGSRAGHCIEFNLRCGRAISADVIMRLVEKRVNSQSAQHRGFVLCGFPLIPNDLFEEDPVSSESAVFNVQEIFDEFLETAIPANIMSAVNVTETSLVENIEEVEGETSVKDQKVIVPEKIYLTMDLGSTTENICTSMEAYKNLEDQINFLFSLLSPPYLIIYIVCENSEVVAKHSEYRYDVEANKVVDLQKERMDRLLYTIFSSSSIQTTEVPEDIIYLTKGDNVGIDYSNRFDLLRLPRDFPANILTQLEKYRYEALAAIQKQAMMHDPQYVMKLDGRISASRMFYAVKMRLKVLPFQKVIIPEKLNVPPEPTGAEDEIIEKLNFDGLTLDDCFNILCRKSTASPMFKWSWSNWGKKCPVSMKDGVYTDGDPNYAVHFLNKIFFLADEAAFVKFNRNPRPYLLPPFPKPGSKIFVMGLKQSGKIAVAKCLGYVLNVPVLAINKLQNEFVKQKEAEYLDNIRSSAINEIMTKLTAQRREEHITKEQERVNLIDTWKHHNLALIYFYQKKTATPIKIINPTSSFPVSLVTEVPLIEEDPKYEEAYDVKIMNASQIEEELLKNNITCYKDLEESKKMLQNPDKILNFFVDAPLTPYAFQAPEVYDEEVVTYVNDCVENANLESIELTTEDIIDMFSKAIKNLEETTNSNGWIISGMPANLKLLQGLQSNFADEIFILTDTSEDHEFLVNRFRTKSISEFTDFRGLFLDLDKKQAAMRAPSILSTDSYKRRMATDILKNIVEICPIDIDDEEQEEEEEEEEEEPEEEYFKYYARRPQIEQYKKQLQQFDEDIEKVNELLKEFNVSVTELDVANKSFPTLLAEIIYIMDNKFRQAATIFTADDRIDEVKDFGEPEVILDEELGEEAEPETAEDNFMKNRRYGDTFHYCPVTFGKTGVLWKGKEEIGAKFEDKLYFMRDEEALENFIEDPKKYLLGIKPPIKYPPPRICIIGCPGSGKTTFSRKLSNNLGLYCLNFLKELKKSNSSIENYLKENEPLAEEILNKILSPLWFHEPMQVIGFVLDGFPRRSTDIDYMIKNLLIPDVVIELTAMPEILRERLLKISVQDWQIKTFAEQASQDRINKEIIEEWEKRKEERIKEILEQKKQERYLSRISEKEGGSKKENIDAKAVSQNRLEEIKEEDEEKSVIRLQSQISYDSVAEQMDYEDAKNYILEELPQPELLQNWETLEEATERIKSEIEENYNVEFEHFSTIREYCDTQLIPYYTVDANLDFDNVFAQVMKIAAPINFRNESLFERCYDITVDLAETLLNNGYYFISKFGRTCPVQYYEKHDSFQLYLCMEQKFQLFPVIFRQYIYFLSGKKNRDKFKENPMKYTSVKNYSFPLISYRVAIIGPPKCGKTTIAERFKNDLGLKSISIGQAIRYVLAYLPYTDLAKQIDSVLTNGWELTSEMEMKCVGAMCLEARSVTQGCIFDGFPNMKDEIYYLAVQGLGPHLVIDLKAEKALVFNFLAGAAGLRGLPTFSKTFIDHRYDIWDKFQETFRDWLDTEYQNICKVSVIPCKWGVWHAAFELAAAVLSEIKYYYAHVNEDVVLRLANMQITQLEYNQRKSPFKNYCPACLFYNKGLKYTEIPPDRTGLVQFRYYYYWLCDEHLEKFISDPDQYLTPYNPNVLPEHLPIRRSFTEKPADAYEDGICIVCYIENLPEKIFNPGDCSLCIEFREKIYMFDKRVCCDKFMAFPEKYYSKIINFKGAMSESLSIKKLPTLGYLEQFDATQIIKAINNTVNNRPLLCGLSVSQSAAINVALHLKIHNPKTPKKFIPMYEDAMKLFHERRNRFVSFLAMRKKYLNPFLYYEEPLGPLILPDSMASFVDSNSSSNKSVVALIDEMLDKIKY